MKNGKIKIIGILATALFLILIFSFGSKLIISEKIDKIISVRAEGCSKLWEELFCNVPDFGIGCVGGAGVFEKVSKVNQCNPSCSNTNVCYLSEVFSSECNGCSVPGGEPGGTPQPPPSSSLIFGFGLVFFQDTNANGKWDSGEAVVKPKSSTAVFPDASHLPQPTFETIGDISYSLTVSHGSVGPYDILLTEGSVTSDDIGCKNGIGALAKIRNGGEADFGGTIAADNISYLLRNWGHRGAACDDADIWKTMTGVWSDYVGYDSGDVYKLNLSASRT